MKTVTELTEAQQDRMASYAQEWIDRGWRITPLTEQEWSVWEDGARYFYEQAGLTFPSTIIRVPSPMVGAFAAPIAAYVLAKLRQQGMLPDSAVGSAVDSAVGSAVDSAVDSAVGSAVDSAVRSAVDSAVRSAVDSAVRSAVGSAVRSAVDSAVRSAVGSAVGSAVDSAVDSAVHSAVGSDREVLLTISRAFYAWLGGRSGGGWYYAWGLQPWWLAYWGFFRDVVGLELDGDLWDRTRNAEAASSAGYWWPFEDFVMVCDNPVELHVESAGGEKRMHCETGPAISWADGYGIYMWHGVQVPAWVIHEPTVDRAIKEPNSEIRRAALEHIGWPQVIQQLGAKPIATCADPANDPHELALYKLPVEFYDEPVNLLIMTNGSPDRSGEQRIYGETCPAELTDPLAAAAWQYGVSVDVYARLERRT